MRFVNLNPHKVRLHMPDGREITVQRSGIEARIEEERQSPFVVPGIPMPVIELPIMGRLAAMQPPQDGVAYLVNRIMLMHPALWGRTDVFAPDSGPSAIRTEKGGHTYAVTQLMRAPAEVSSREEFLAQMWHMWGAACSAVWTRR